MHTNGKREECAPRVRSACARMRVAIHVGRHGPTPRARVSTRSRASHRVAKRRLDDRLEHSYADLTSVTIPSLITLEPCSDADGREAARNAEARASSRTWVRAYACTKASRAIRLERRTPGVLERALRFRGGGAIIPGVRREFGDNDEMSDWSVSEELPSDAASAFRDLFRLPPGSFPIERASQ